VNFVIATEKGHIPPVGMAFEMDNSMCCSSLCHKEHFKNRNIIKQHIRFLAVTAVLGITIFATLIYFAGQTTSAVNLSLIAISIPLFIMVLSRIAFKESAYTKMIGIATIILSFNTNYQRLFAIFTSHTFYNR
jgi:drug/metabolite transporter (DMT)-like permease